MDWVALSTGSVRVFDLMGVAANALLAAPLARSRGFDAVGFVFLGISSGLGGGLLRDTLLQAGPPAALADPAYLVTALVTAGLAYLFLPQGRWWSRGLRFLDAAALGTWGAVGALKTLDVGLSPLAAILLGTITAVGGGIIRDVLADVRPVVFERSTLYATAAMAAAGAAVLVGTVTSASWRGVATLTGTVVGATLTLLAYRFGWRLPTARTWRPWPST